MCSPGQPAQALAGIDSDEVAEQLLKANKLSFPTAAPWWHGFMIIFNLHNTLLKEASRNEHLR